MPRFFVTADQISNDEITVIGEDAHHITRVLRMSLGDKITICDMQMNEYACNLEKFGECVTARIMNVRKIDAEPPFRVHLYQALPKGDKLDTIIQKAVECGVYDITPFESERCIARPKTDVQEKKTERRRRIAHEAAKQSGRGIVPQVYPTVSFERMLKDAGRSNIVIFCYEGDGTRPLSEVLSEYRANIVAAGFRQHDDAAAYYGDISLIIGPEGGFALSEVDALRRSGAVITGLGKRILRTETAAAFALACIIYEFELNKV